ncbi:MAG: gamma-glutamyl phosphate reductase [Pseudonocardiaceae bacterium]|nr:gamma-glutamyl phosphate reductase [Pseudonocardiaceae bacterium]
MRQLFPTGPETDARHILAELTADPDDGPLVCGDERVIDFLTRFARKLLAPGTARAYPELASLGFFLRKGEIGKALRSVHTTDGVFRFPRGLAFHVPPANVDTIFVYSWALSALAGNRNVVRVSPRTAGAGQAVLDALNEIDVHPAIAQTQRMVGYQRDDEATAALSAACDLRVLWGGDRAIAALRRHPLAPHARELTFPDRASFAAISLPGWRKASQTERREAVRGFYNDAYWFDQAACASPRAVFWIGEPAEAPGAQREFRALLREVLDEQRYVTDPAMAVQQRVAGYGMAADGLASGLGFDAGVATIQLAEPGAVPREWLAAGTFAHATLRTLPELAKIVRRKDQTLTQFGFTDDELARFVRATGGSGVDRIVSFGSALTFSPVWDGYDLLHEFTRLVTVRST